MQGSHFQTCADDTVRRYHEQFLGAFYACNALVNPLRSVWHSSKAGLFLCPGKFESMSNHANSVIAGLKHQLLRNRRIVPATVMRIPAPGFESRQANSEADAALFSEGSSNRQRADCGPFSGERLGLCCMLFIISTFHKIRVRSMI